MREDVPILLVIFNRPEPTRRVVGALRQVRPVRLFVAADGPRSSWSEDAENCRLARQAAMQVDWPCQVKTRFLDENIGCGRAVSSAITWFFEHVEHGIILEDDCVPHPDFFPFCAELFKRYAEDERVMRIAGLSPYPKRDYPYDYHFSRRFHCWGWGTWRRAWKHFSYDLSAINEAEFLEMVRAYYPFAFRRRTRLAKFRQARSGILTTWAFRWEVACYAQNGLTVVPEKNLITNIGYGADATHTRHDDPVFSNLEAHPLKFPLRHPPFVYADERPVRALERMVHRHLPFKSRCAEQLRHATGALSDLFDTLP